MILMSVCSFGVPLAPNTSQNDVFTFLRFCPTLKRSSKEGYSVVVGMWHALNFLSPVSFSTQPAEYYLWLWMCPEYLGGSYSEFSFTFICNFLAYKFESHSSYLWGYELVDFRTMTMMLPLMDTVLVLHSRLRSRRKFIIIIIRFYISCSQPLTSKTIYS